MNRATIKKNMSFDTYLKSQLKKPGIRKGFDEEGKQIEVAYEILQLRKKRGVSQLELAKKIGTTQGNIARIETGKQNLSISLLSRIGKALDKELIVKYA